MANGRIEWQWSTHKTRAGSFGVLRTERAGEQGCMEDSSSSASSHELDWTVSGAAGAKDGDSRGAINWACKRISDGAKKIQRTQLNPTN